MSNNNKQAYVRGRKVAMILKRLKGIVLTWDQRCMAWVKHHKLPAWVGHVPVFIAVLATLAGILLGGIVIAGCLIFIWAIAFILQQIGQTNHLENDADHIGSKGHDQPLTEYRNGDQGYGLYCGSYRMDQDEEG